MATKILKNVQRRVHHWLNDTVGRKTAVSVIVVTPLTLALEYAIVGDILTAVTFVLVSISGLILGSYWEEVEEELEDVAESAADKAEDVADSAKDAVDDK